MDLAEWGQWLVLATLALLVLGLYRQVGEVLVGSKELAMHQFGPEVGEEIFERWDWLIVEDWATKGGGTAAIFVSDTCSICHDVLDQLEQLLQNRPMRFRAAVALVCDGGDDYADQLGARFQGMVVEQIARIEPSGGRPAGYPFGVLVGPDGTVSKKDLGGSVLGLAVEAIDGSFPVVMTTARTVEV